MRRFVISAVKRLIASKIKVLVYIMCVVYIYYVYINTHTNSIFCENIYMYIHIIYIIYKQLIYKHNIFLKYIHACVWIYIHNKYTQHTRILCKQKLLFWMQLITINRWTALFVIFKTTKTSRRFRLKAGIHYTTFKISSKISLFLPRDVN